MKIYVQAFSSARVGNTRAVDTNVIVRLITRDDEVQVKAAEKFIAERSA